MKITMTWIGVVVLWVVLSSQVARCADRNASYVGHWAGWAYSRSGSNFPLRLHVEIKGDDALSITIDFSEDLEEYGIQVADVRIEGDKLHFRTTNNEYASWLKNGELHGSSSRGDTIRFDFELAKSPAPIYPANPDDAEDAKGIYRAEDGQVCWSSDSCATDGRT